MQFAGVGCFESSSLSLSGAILRPHRLFAMSASLGCIFSPVASLDSRILSMSSRNLSVSVTSADGAGIGLTSSSISSSKLSLAVRLTLSSSSALFSSPDSVPQPWVAFHVQRSLPLGLLFSCHCLVGSLLYTLALKFEPYCPYSH